MNGYEKSQIAGVLQIAKLAGFTVRGFRELGPATRGSGHLVEAASVSKDGESVTELYVGGSCGAGYRIDWTVTSWVSREDPCRHADGYGTMQSEMTAEHSVTLNVQMSDDGELRLAESDSGSFPAAPSWT